MLKQQIDALKEQEKDLENHIEDLAIGTKNTKARLAKVRRAIKTLENIEGVDNEQTVIPD